MNLPLKPENNRIYKYPFGILSRGEFTATINNGQLSDILDVQEQANHLVLWASVDINQTGSQQINIKVCWTGDQEPDLDRWVYWKTIQGSDGLVYHVYIDFNYLH